MGPCAHVVDVEPGELAQVAAVHVQPGGEEGIEAGDV